jgi:4-hydroxy-4-methyl-2-oxoglutarate aldolase
MARRDGFEHQQRQNLPRRGHQVQLDQGPRGKVLDFRLPVEIDGVRVRPGDPVFGDSEGVCIVPQEAKAEALARAVEKARGKKLVRQATESGMSASEAFRIYGIM